MDEVIGNFSGGCGGLPGYNLQTESCMERILNDIISRFYTPFSH